MLIKPNHPGPFKKPDSCKTCPLYGNGVGFAYPDTGGMNGVLVVTDGLVDEKDVLNGKVFVGGAGAQFNTILKRGGLQRQDFTAIDSVIHCRAPQGKLSGSPYEYEATLKCEPFLDETIERFKPKAILAMGGTALKRLTGQVGIQRNRGFIFESKYGIPVVGTYHPSYLLPRLKEKAASKYTWVVIMDMRKALRIARGQRELLPQTYLLDPSVDGAAQFVGEYERTLEDTLLAWDLETVYKLKHKNEQKIKLENKQTITRISFAFKAGHALTIPWEPEYVEKIVKPLFRLRRPKVDWNGLGFDRPIIIFQEGMEMNGQLIDGMDVFHTFQPNLERNLEFATSILTDHLQPWKHRSQSDPEWYSAVDSDAELTNVLRLRQMMMDTRVPDYDQEAA